MPQLWTETFVTQYFWLVAIILGFYYLAVTEIIPQIAFTLKTRKELEIDSKKTNSNVTNKESNTNNVINNSTTLLSTCFTAAQKKANLTGKNSHSASQEEVSTTQIKNSINSIKTEWVKKFSI